MSNFSKKKSHIKLITHA